VKKRSLLIDIEQFTSN